jgi:hypothetical protein
MGKKKVFFFLFAFVQIVNGRFADAILMLFGLLCLSLSDQLKTIYAIDRHGDRKRVSACY